jgi:UDP-N-acetylglucosamine acyltransferase
MPNTIHPTAIIAPSVKLGDNVSVGPYTVIDGDVVIGDNVEIQSHCYITGSTKIGNGCRIFPSAMIGNEPQDKKFKRGAKTFLEIGENNIIREFCTLNPGTTEGGGITRVGNNNLFMAYCHVAHDCQVGNDCVFANAATLAGHVHVEDRVVVGGLTGIHQFVHVGKMCIIGGCSKVVQDIPPYSMCDGHPAEVYNINAIGLKRAEVPLKTVKLIKEAFRILFYMGLGKTNAIERIEKEVELVPEIQHIIEFARASERGLCGAAASSE